MILAGPLIIGAAHALGGLVTVIPAKDNWYDAGGVVAVLTGLVIAISFWLAALIFSRQFSPYALQPALILTVLVFLVFLVYGFWSGWKNAFWLAGTFSASILFFMSVGKVSQLSFLSSAQRPSGILREETHRDILRLVTDVETLSAQRTGDPHAMPLQIQISRPVLGAHGTQSVVAEPDPLLGWYFRSMNRLGWALSPSANVSARSGTTAITVLPMNVDENLPPAAHRFTDEAARGATKYVGSRYSLRSYWRPADLRRDTPGVEISPEAGLWAKLSAGFHNRWDRQMQPALRWMLYGEITEMPTLQKVVLWVAGEP
jgi:hypothetical protein